MSVPSISVESVLDTPLLWSRTPSAPRWKEETEAFGKLAGQLARDPGRILQTLVQEGLRLCRAGSAGVSLLEEDDHGPTVFRLVAVAGECAPYMGRSTPRNFSPCGLCLDQNQPVLLSYPARLFTYFSDAPVPIVEGLVLPLATDKHVFGTIWIMSHDETRHFDGEDVRVMKGLADFTAAALRLQTLNQKLTTTERHREALVCELKRSNDELSRFSHVVAHDLQTHVRTIHSYVELLTRNHRGDGDDDLRSTIKVASRGMQSLINSLLKHAEAGNGDLQITAFSIGDVLDAVEMSMAAQLKDTGGEIRRGALPEVEADRDQIQQLLQNLISNGIKYRREDVRPVISISGFATGNGWEFSVEDNGIGIESQYIEAIFEPLKRLHGPEIPGTGLGLAICSSIVERHGGRICVRSEVGRGSTFSFTLRRPEHPSRGTRTMGHCHQRAENQMSRDLQP
jgi:signal transduction histidine kinase